MRLNERLYQMTFCVDRRCAALEKRAELLSAYKGRYGVQSLSQVFPMSALLNKG